MWGRSEFQQVCHFSLAWNYDRASANCLRFTGGSTINEGYRCLRKAHSTGWRGI
jgi:hypothetical protein